MQNASQILEVMQQQAEKGFVMQHLELGPIEQDLQIIKGVHANDSGQEVHIIRDIEVTTSDFVSTADERQREDAIKETAAEVILELNQDDPLVQEVISISNERANAQNTLDINSPPDFKIAETGTKRGGRLLLDNRGYSFTVKLSGKKATTWKCSVRSRVNRCPATVRQTADGFLEGKQGHNHDPKPRSFGRVNLVSEIKERSKKMMHDTARHVVIDVIAKHYSQDLLSSGIPNTQALIRLANRARATLRPTNPKNLRFKINEHFMPQDFIKADIVCDSNRHLLMATSDQLSILADTKVWLIDCTSKFVMYPFAQLLSVQTYLRVDDEPVTVPLAFVLMSKNRQRDYKAAFEHLTKLLPHRQSVKKCVLHFDVPLWKAFKSVFPNVSVQGCAFQWISNVLRKLPNSTLDAEVNLSRKIMSLAYLPAEEIEETFLRLQKKNKRLQIVFKYVDKWINHSYWGPEKWSVFQQIVRTRKDVEHWHENVEVKAKGQGLGLYKLVEQLNNVSILELPLHWKMLSLDKLYNLQKEKADWQQARLFKLWKKYLRHKISIDDLLDNCTILDFPIPS